MRMCTMPTKEGRITLTDNHFKVVKENDVLETAITNDSEFTAFLKEHFDLDLDFIKPEK
jgi:N-hydroxyarylamine O-acetyltransferase